MFDEQDRQYFYNEFKSNGYEVGSYDDFKKDLNNKEDRDWYYNEAKNMGYDVGTQADFDKMVLEPAASASPSTGGKQVVASAQASKPQVAQPVAKPKTEYPQEVLDAYNSPDNKPGNFKDLAQLNDEYQRGELKKPGFISQALGMIPKVDAGNIGREQKMGGMIANMLLGDNMQQPQQTQQPQDINQQVQQPAQQEASPESKEEVPVTASAAVVNNEGLMDAKLANYLENWKQRPDKQGTYFENMVADLLADGTANSNEEAVQMVQSALGRYANRSAMDVTNQVVASLPDDTVQDAEQSIEAQWYSHGVQDKLKQEADSMGISYDDYVGQFLKPAMVQSLVNKYGPNYRDIAEGIATRLYSHDEHVQDRLMNQDINEALSDVISKYVSPSVVDEYNKAQEAGSKAFTEGMEGSQFIPANLRLGTALGAQYEANEAKDPAKVLSGLQKKFGKLYRNPEFLNDMSNAAFKVMQRYGLNGTQSSDPKQFKPMINSVLKTELDQLEIKGMMPKGSAEYIMKTGLGNTIVGKITRKAVQTDYQNWLEDMANQQYQPGFWENVASGALTFAGDAWSYWLPGAAGGKLTKSMIAKAEGKLAGDLMAKGMERKVAERAAKVLIGKSKDVALKNGAVHGAVTFGGQSAISKPIDEVYRTGQFDENGKIYNPSVGKVIANTLGEVTKQSAVGAIMQGGTIANMIGKGRGLATNILADVGGKVVDSGIMTGQQLLERMAHDPNFKPTGKDAAESFLESMANLTAIGLPGMVGKYARFKDAREFNKKFDFTDQDIAELKRFGYEDLRDAFEKVGIGEYAVEGENAQRLDGQLTQKYMDLMNDKSVPEVLKAKMMAVVEGKRPSSFSPVIDSEVYRGDDGKYYLETYNKDGGVIDRKEYSSHDAARNDEKKLEYEKTLGLASVLEGEFHKEFTQEHLDGLYNKAAQKYNMGEKLTDEDKAAVYLHQNAGAIKDIMDKQQKGIILTEEEQKQVNAYRHYYDSALENSSVMREFVNTFEDSHGVARGTLRKALESKDKKYAPLVESYLKELYNSIELKREMKQTMEDLYNTAHGNEQKRIEQSGNEIGGAPEDASSGPAPYQDRTNSVPSPNNAEFAANPVNSSVEVPPTEPPTPPVEGETPTNESKSDAYVMGQNAYQKGDAEGLKAIDHNDDVSKARLKRAFGGDEAQMNVVVKAYEDGKDMEQFLAQRSGYMTPAQQDAVRKYVEAQDAKNGVYDALQHADDGYGEALKEQLWPYQTEDGNIVPATLTTGQQVFLKKANEYGGGFVVVPDEQGQPTIKQVSSADIKEVGTPVPMDDYINQQFAEQVDARYKQFRSQFDGSGFKRGDIVSVSMEAGDEPSDVKIVGYTEDGRVILTDTDVDVNSQIDPDKLEVVTKDEFNAWRQNAIDTSIGAELDAEDAQRANDDAVKAEAEKKQRYNDGIVGLGMGQPDYSSKDTEPKVAAEYLQEQYGEDHGKLLNLVNGSRDDIKTQLANKKKAAAEYQNWLDTNADLDPEKAQKVENDLALVNEQIADLDARFKNWNAIRNSVMTPDEVKAMKEERKAEVEKAGVDETAIVPSDDFHLLVLDDKELKKQYPTMDEANDYITSQRKDIYHTQEDVEHKMNDVNDMLEQYINGETELDPTQLMELNTTKAQLEALQTNLSVAAKGLKAQANKLSKLYKTEVSQQEMKELGMTPSEQRKALVADSLKKNDLGAIKEIYKDASVDITDLTPQTLEEAVSESLSPHSLNPESLQYELGKSNFKFGIGKRYDSNKFNYLIAKKGTGMSVNEFAVRVYNDLPVNLQDMGYTEQDVRNALLDMFKSYDSVKEMKNVALMNRIAAAEDELASEEEYYEAQKEREIIERQAENPDYYAYLEDNSVPLPTENELNQIAGMEYDRMMEIEDREREYKQYVKSILPELADYDDRSNEEGYGGGRSLGSDSSRRGVDEGNRNSQEGGSREASAEAETGALHNSTGEGRQEISSLASGESSADRTPHLPQEASFGERLKSAIAETETEPTEAQKKAGNYKKGHLSFGGYDFTVETPKGTTRSGKDEQGKPWSVTMHDTYGYILGKIGVDGDHIDMFINDAADLDFFDGNVYVVDQVNPETGEFDEHKVMYGYPSEEAATEAYLANYSKDWKGLGKVTSVPKATFDKWLESSDRKTKPFADYAMVQMEQAKFDRDVKEVKPSEMTEAQKVAYDAVSAMLKKAGIPVKVVSNEDMEKVAEAQDNLNLAMLLNHPEMRFKIKTPEEKQAAENAYNFAKELRPDKWKQYAVVDMSNPNKMPEYFEKQELARKERSYYNKLMWGNYKVFNLDKSFEDNVAGLTGSFPSEFDPYKIDAQTSKKNELKKQIKETEEAYKLTGQERKENQNQLMKEYMDEHGLASENDIPDDVWREFDYKAVEKYQDKLDSLFAKYKDLDRQLKAVAEPGVQYLKGKGVVYGYTDGKEIVLNQDHLNANTPIHEYQHLWRTAAKKMNPDLIAHGDELIKQTQLFADLKEDPNYKHLSDDEICDEAFARLTGEDGAAILEQMANDAIKENPLDTAKELSIINRLKNWLKKFWYWTLDTFTKWKPEDIKKMTLEDIRNLVLRDLAQGVDPRTVLNEKKAKKDDKTLAGVHNITEEKLRKALKLGGLANPSLAVIDTNKSAHDNFGEISFIAPSALVDKRTGKTAGTWITDAYTQRYPSVEREMSEKGSQKFRDWVDSLEYPSEAKAEIKRQAEDALSNNNAPAWELMYLKEKGIDIKEYDSRIDYRWKEIIKDHPTAEDILNSMNTDPELNEKVTGLAKHIIVDPIRGKISLEVRRKIYEETGVKMSPLNPQVRKQTKEIFERDYKPTLLDEDGNPKKEDIKKVVEDIVKEHNDTKKYDFYLSKVKASNYVNKNGLYDDYIRWQENKLDEFGTKNRIFRGYTKDGSRKYVPETLENVSKAMREDANGQTNGSEYTSFGSFIAKLASRVDSTDEMRANKGKLSSNEDKEEFYDKWSEVYYDLAKFLYNDVFYGEQRLHDIVSHADPKKYAKNEYGITLTSSFMKKLDSLKNAVQNDLKSAYFETKFNRPVHLNEFVAAVVPNNLGEDVRKGLEESGLSLFDYDPEKEGDRKRAFNEAINSNNEIRFHRVTEVKSPIVEQKLKKHPDSLMKAGTYFSGGGLVEEGLKGIIDPVVAVEYDRKISGVYRNNFGQHIVTADVRDVDPKKLVKHIDGEVEYFHASPVCKNYSQAKSNGGEVELDKETAKSTADFIDAVKPRVVTIENVKGYKDSEAMKIITKALDKNGYTWDADVYNAADFGGYTSRERLIVRAVKEGELPEKPKKQPRKGGWLEAVEDILPTLTEKKNGVAPWMDTRLKADGIDWQKVEKPLYVMGSAYADGKIPHAYGDEILPTLRTKSGDVIIMPGGKVLRADGRVLARITGLGDDYLLPKTESLAHTIIGNGIPVQLTKGVIAPLLNKDDLSGRNVLARLGSSIFKNNWDADMQKQVSDRVVNTSNKLGGAEATVYTSVDEVPDAYLSDVKNGATGWYDPTTHTVHVYLPNCADANEAERTVLHEKIGHEGMEVLLGGENEVRKFANFVYRSASKDVRGKIIDFANKYDPDWKNNERMNVGTQEYIAHLAEEGPKTAEDFSLWTKIKHYLIKVLKKLGVRVPGLLNDKDLRYYLMKAGKALHVWDEMPREKQEALMKQASNAEIKDALSDGAGKGKPRQKKGESAIQYMKRVMEWKRWKEAREDTEDPEPPMFYDFDKDAEGKKEWERLNKDWRDSHGLRGEEMPLRPKRKEGESDDAFMNRYKEWEKWNDAMGDKENPMPDMFSFEKQKQDEARQKYEDWLTRHELNEQNDADLDLYEGKIYPAETNPEADALEQEVMQDLAEVTSTDVSKEGAAKTVKHAVIHRRKNMEEASADDAIYINDVKNSIEKMAESGAFDKLLSDYQGKPNKAEKLAEAIPYIIEAPRRIREIAYKLNSTGVFGEGHIHITPDDVEAVQELRPQLAEVTAKKHTELKDGKEVELFDDMKGASEVASKMADIINGNHEKEPGFVPIDGTDILNKNVLPIILKRITPYGVDYKNLSEPMKSVLDSIRDWYNYTFDWLKDNNTLKADTGFTVDYVNHLWDKEKSDKNAYAMYVENRQRTKSPNEKPRQINTIMEGLEVGLVPKTTDITKMMAYYSRSNIEAWANKTMLQEVSGLNVIERNEDGEIISSDPLLSSVAPFNLEQYKYFEIPGVGPVWVYNVSPKQMKVKNPITGKEKVLYSEASAGDRFGVVFETYQSSPFWKAFDTAASSAKKLELGFSGFHAGALTEVYMVQNMAEFGPKKAMANFMKYIFVDTMKNHQLPCFANPEDFQEAASHLVKFGATNDYAAADVQNMFDNLRDFAQKLQKKLEERGNIGTAAGVATIPFEIATQMVSMLNKGMDVALWDFIHDGLKLASYRMRADRTKERAKKYGWTDEQLSKALDEDGQFVNDMFGGQHWDILGVSQRTFRIAGRVLLSPDWNVSTTRHFMAMTGFGSVWSEATFEDFKNYYNHVWAAARGKESLPPEYFGRKQRQISALICYFIGFLFYEAYANAFNAAFRALDEEKERKKAEELRKTNPNYRSPYELAYPDGMKWYDYLMRGNSLGQQSKIFMGRYADGTEMYIRHGKQFREVPEYLFNHKGELEFPGPMVQRMIGKANPMVRMTLDDINYLSDFQASHADQEIQRKYGKTIGLLYKDALYWAPFLIPSQENKEFKAVDFFFPSSKGFSPWKAQSYFKDFILSGDMEGIVMTYQSCERNGIDAEAQIKAAIGSVRALESAEMQDGVTSLQVASERFDEAKSITEKKKMRQKMKKFLSMSAYKAFTQKEALDMVQSYLNGEDDLKEMEKAENKYLMKAKSEDVTEDWRIQAVWNGTMETYDEYQRLKEVDKAKANAFKNSKTNKRLFAARKAISAAKKKMNKAKKQMDGQNDAAKMVEIRKTRKELIETLNGME
uniref:Cytosine DNA methyltransferase n=1 Tax=Podoviridae sp. ctJDl18 TaxID=2825242 RepID=A0A8S5V0C8_9CAUD|nr:MAG TPA: cytosine DNA methyltransferase [Podoviridae sp. ctJDl18]